MIALIAASYGVWYFQKTEPIGFPFSYWLTPFAILTTSLVTGAAFFLGFSYLLALLRLKNIFDVGKILNKDTVVSKSRLFIAVSFLVMALASYLVLKYMEKSDFWEHKILFYPYSWLYTASAVPLRAQIAHIMFFGPLTLILYLHWERLSQAAARLGIAASILIVLAPFLALNAESRQLSFPMVISFSIIMQMFSGQFKTSVFLPVFLSILCIIYAQPWYAYFAPQLEGTAFYEKDFQYYFKFQGPWMTPHSMLVHCLWIAPLSIISFKYYRLNSGKFQQAAISGIKQIIDFEKAKERKI